MKPDTRERIMKWLETKDFDAGVALLARHNPRLAKNLRGKEKFKAGKLEYELKKVAGMDHISALARGVAPHHPDTTTVVMKEPVKKPQLSTNSVARADSRRGDSTRDAMPKPIRKQKEKAEVFSLASAHKGLGEVPPEVELIVKEHSRLFMLRSQLSDERQQLGDSNKPNTIKKRKVLTQAIHTHSERIEQLFQAHAEFLRTRRIPDMGALFGDKSFEITPPPDPELLKKERTKLMGLQHRDRTRLTYNSEKKEEKVSPMPEGPRREAIMARMAQRTERIQEIEKILKELE